MENTKGTHRNPSESPLGSESRAKRENSDEMNNKIRDEND